MDADQKIRNKLQEMVPLYETQNNNEEPEIQKEEESSQIEQSTDDFSSISVPHLVEDKQQYKVRRKVDTIVSESKIKSMLDHLL